ncbi:CDP-glycerol glycerophosphotransferase family protein [Spongiibacter taiwanensis]|uniref:CDP-glycerol glycerophosphotransferase family protein n=1 Tax=Spongiibacter taiwanensis TaxID=1748242 RepID=UPI002035DB56|nr:CDP-glycerol glycerophosphotransferase family protein [Spongiibacter taiwanensis]USA44259.1 CDP-glycerol glycerophosphotransferase family protein [Spongiibacter taiwanensis]
MKVNKRNPWHWLWLGLLTVNAVLAVILRKFVASNNRVILYGHKLNGNLGAIYRESLKHKALRLTYLTMDYPYYRKLKQQKVDVVWAGSPRALLLLTTAKVLISDHGLHSLVLLLDYSKLKFIDVWHGIPFKGFDKDDFKVQHRYDEVWVASEFMADLYEKKFGFKKDKLKAIGYARTDVLVKPGKIDRAALMREYDIPASDRTVILYAPTWQQDDAGRSLYPFGMEEAEFLDEMSRMAEKLNFIFVVRMHLNASKGYRAQFENVYAVPADDYPDTERLLLLSDILIYDWSSIAFDFLLLDRSAICFDVPPPFKKGLSLDKSYRNGEVVANLEEFRSVIASMMENKDMALHCIDEHRNKIKTRIYERLADGSSSARACQEISKII